MPKVKTHKGAASRFRVTATGKLMRVKGPKSHLRRKKSARVKRLFMGTVPLSGKARVKKMRQLIGA